MKKLLANSLVLFIAAALGLLIGFALRGKHGDADPSIIAALPDGSPGKVAEPSEQSAPIRVNDDSPLATKLEHDLSMSSGVTRWLYWLEAMEKASASDYPRLYQLARGNPAATRLVSQRWIELYPRHLFDTVVGAIKSGRGMTRDLADLSYALFREWPKRDPEAAIAALNEAGSFQMGGPRDTVAAAVIEKDPERGLRLFSEWSLDNFGPRMTAISKWAAADPRHAAEFALANPAGYATRLTMETIGKEWAKIDPAKALEFAVSKPGDFTPILASSVLKEWATRNLDQAAGWLAATDVQTRNRLSPSFVESWAKQDANKALDWCEANLSGTSLAQGVAGVIRGSAEKNVAAAAALVTSLNPSAARAEAAGVVARQWFPNGLGDDKPADRAAVAWLASLDKDSAQRVLDEVQWSWATCDPRSMAAFLLSSPEPFSQTSYSILARELARKYPQEAVEWTSSLPKGTSLTAGSDAFAEWHHSQPEAAMKWFNNLPPDDARRQPFFENAIRETAWDPATSSTLAALPENERAIARKVIEGMKLPEDRKVFLIGMLSGH